MLENEFVSPPENYSSNFPWKGVGAFIDPLKTNRNEIHGIISSSNADKMNTYISEKYYADLYWNCSLVICMCFCSWCLSYIGFGVTSFVFVCLCGFVVYRAEFRRFNNNLRDDMQRVHAQDTLENKLESMEWLNSFLAKFWILYMPALSDLVITSTNLVLAEVSPPPPIDKVSLDKFTLGSKAPKIESIKSFTKLGKDLYQMDWSLDFTPNDTDDMTANEIKKKIDPQVALGIRVGKGFVGASLPVLVEDMTFKGLLRIKLKIGDSFPHIDVVSICFLEQPFISYALKPVGGNTFGLDIMSLIPGLESFVNGLIHSNLAPILYAPNSLDINVNEIVESTLPSALGCLAIKIRGAEYFSANGEDINPYIKFGPENDISKKFQTDIKASTNIPIFNETQHVLIDNLSSRLLLELFTLKKSGDSNFLGEASFELQDLLQDGHKTLIESKLVKNNRSIGKVFYDLVWFPVLKGEEKEDGKFSPPPESDCGIFEFTLISASNLDNSKSMIGKLSTFAEIYINEELFQTSRLAKGSNNPEFKCKIEKLINSKNTTSIKILIKDISSFGETTVATYESTSLRDLIYVGTDKSKKIKFTEGLGEMKISSVWKPLQPVTMDDDLTFVAPVGVARLYVKNVKNLPTMKTLATIDPYLEVSSGGKVRGISDIFKNNLNPKFEDVFYLPVLSENQDVDMTILDYQNGKDRVIGSLNLNIGNFINKSQNGLVNDSLKRNGKSVGTIEYSVEYYPMMNVMTHKELTALEEKKNDDEEDLEDLQEQAKFLEDYKKHPDEYEWIEDEDKNLIDSNKIFMSLEESMEHNSGVLGINLLNGKLKDRTAYVQIFIDDREYPDFISAKSNNFKINSHSGEVFIRDLQNSILTIRITRTEKVRCRNDIIATIDKPLNVISLLKEGYSNPYKINIDDNSLSFMFEYVPSQLSINLNDTVVDTGMLTLCIVGAKNLKAADRNGFSDPFANVIYNDKNILKTQVIKKNCNPEWNEQIQVPIKSRVRGDLKVHLYDWDMAGDNDYLGTSVIDLVNMKLNTEETLEVPIIDQGTLTIKATFVPGYLRGNGEFIEGSAFELVDPFALASNVAGGALNVANNLAGGAIGVTGGALNIAGNTAGNMLGATEGVVGSAGGFMKKLSHVASHKNTPDPQGAPSSAASIQSTRIPQLSQPKSSLQLKAPKFHNRHASHGSIRSSMDIQSVNTATFNGTKSIPGRISVSDLMDADINKSIQIKVSLSSASGKSKVILKTRSIKANVQHEFSFHEQAAFRCDPSGVMKFTVNEHHVLGKDTSLGEGEIELQSVIGVQEDFVVEVGCGKLVVNFNYGSKD